MKPHSTRLFVSMTTVLVAVAFPILVPATSPVPPTAAAAKDDDDQEVIVLCPFEVSAGFGATPGGAQDIGFFRMGAGRGEIPHPEAITAEGLFSEHDLPLEVKDGGDELFIVQTAAAEARFEVLPEVRYLAQLGFSSGLRPDTWRRAPLNLVAVVDKSGSMSGEPLALVRASLLSALEHLRDGDQLSVVLYGDTSHVFLDPTPVKASTRAAIARRIREIDSAGSTAMEAGLALGFRVARGTAEDFAGTTRVMLFTDERPNVGNTAAEGFMAMAETASRDGIGLTTIGVGVQFGAELATRISSVRGGNLFFFEDGAAMKETFAGDFDMMVTELAHEFRVRIAPAAGLRIAGVFGVPGEMLRWEGDAIVFDVASIFLSRRRGAIFVALAPVQAARDLPPRTWKAGEDLAKVNLGYERASDGRRVSGVEGCRLLAGRDMQVGLMRGAVLVDEYLALRKAAGLHLFDNDQERAFRIVDGLLSRITASKDPELAREIRLVADMHATLALLSGHVGEIQPAPGARKVSPLVGVWRGGADSTGDYLVIWANGVIDFVVSDPKSGGAERAETLVLDGKVPRRARGAFRLHEADRARLGSISYAIDRDTLRLEIARWHDGTPAHLEFARHIDDSKPKDDESAARNGSETTEMDELTGLPEVAKASGQAG